MIVKFQNVDGKTEQLDLSKRGNIAFNADCMEFLRNCPDNAFALSCVDPPYGGGCAEANGSGIKVERRDGTWAAKYNKGTEISVHRSNKPGGTHRNYELGTDIRKWDVAPSKEYFDELFRVSKNQIIWGGNYFELPPTRCFLIWRKLSISENFSMAMCEYAWTSFNDNAKLFEHVPQGKDRFHPCLPSGTLVRFGGKWKPIEDVHVGEKNEFGTVAAITTHNAEKLVEIEVDGKLVTATWNHPFLVKRIDGIYWVNAEQIEKGDELLSLWKRDMLSQKKDIYVTEQTEKDYGWSIALFGKKTMVQFRKVCKSIIKTLTRPITIFPISCLSRPLNTNGCTKVADLSTAFGISLAKCAANTRLRQKKTGTSRVDGLPVEYAENATSKKFAKNAVCVSQTVGSVKIIHQKTKVYNLSVDGIPAFETVIGITHNTQKPVALYEWIFSRYAKPGDKILDTHLGSGSSRIAAYNAGLDFVGYEIDETYFKLEEERFRKHTQQVSFIDIIGGTNDKNLS